MTTTTRPGPKVTNCRLRSALLHAIMCLHPAAAQFPARVQGRPCLHCQSRHEHATATLYGGPLMVAGSRKNSTFILSIVCDTLRLYPRFKLAVTPSCAPMRTYQRGPCGFWEGTCATSLRPSTNVIEEFALDTICCARAFRASVCSLISFDICAYCC